MAATVTDPKVSQFCQQVRQRSAENQQAFRVLMERELHGAALSLVRQELDSMIRVIYLLELKNSADRDRLIDDSISGRHWKRLGKSGKWVRITDREMADSALKRHRWIEQIYQYGCNLIHLSDWHGYKGADPTQNMSCSEREKLLLELEYFHAEELGELSFRTLLMHAPYAIGKIGSNLECYLKDLETGSHATSGAVPYP